MAGVETREGMACETVQGPVTLTFTPVPLKPYLLRVECSGCDASWTTDGRPEDYEPWSEGDRRG